MRKHARVFVSLLGMGVVVCFLAASLQAQSGAPQAAAAAPATQPPTQDDPSIVSVRVVSETGSVLDESPAALAGLLGKPIDAETIRESLRALYRTGRFADLRAESFPVAGGIRLDFIVRENLFFNLVRIKGLREPPTEGQALVSLGLTPGEIFRQSSLDAALDRLRDTLREDGLYQARVSSVMH